ncbi:MAG: DNA mismatch repair protein MutS [Chloroflexota bacterium]
MMAVTPLRRQYLRVKEKHPGALVFFRLGDFYETFDEDAKIASRELDIVLTSREMGKGNKVPMAGIPFHALDNYLSRLISRGYKVAVCEQLTPAGNGLVERDVIRVVTPGTVLEPSLLKSKVNNYLVSMCVRGERAGVAYADITTGEFAVSEIPSGRVECELARLQPAEVLVPEDEEALSQGSPVTPLDPYWFENDVALRLLLEHFEVATLDGFGCRGMPLAVEAAGALLHYLSETQKQSLRLVTALSTYSTDAFMTLDVQTLRNLELFEGGRWGETEISLLSILDETLTPMGGRLLRAWIAAPLLDLGSLEARQGVVDWFFSDLLRRQETRRILSGMGDIERVMNRVVSSRAVPRDLAGLRASLSAIPSLREAVGDMPDGLEGRLYPVSEAVSLLQSAIAEDPGSLEKGGVIRDGFSDELDRLRATARDARAYLADLEKSERERTGIKSLKVGYNRVFGYYIEISRTNLTAVPDDYQRKQTLAEAERFFTPQLKEYESNILTASEQLAALEESLFLQVCEQLAGYSEVVVSVSRAIASIDACCALAEVAANRNYVRPALHTGDDITIRGGRHPIVEARLESGTFVPNDTELSNDNCQIVILTGPNMAGKSTYLRQVALIVLMAQTGSFVPAKAASVGIVDRIFTRVGAQEDLASGQSTFMVEMIETANILHHATRRSLIVLDEIGRGTSTYDGISIAWAVAEHIHNAPGLGAKTVFATHYHELVELAEHLPRVRNYNVLVVEEAGKVRLLHQIAPGAGDRSYGIHVATLAGLPRAVVARARNVLDALEASAREGPVTGRHPDVSNVTQLPMFPSDPWLAREIADLDVDSMTPLEAISVLYGLKNRVLDSEGNR